MPNVPKILDVSRSDAGFQIVIEEANATAVTGDTSPRAVSVAGKIREACLIGDEYAFVGCDRRRLQSQYSFRRESQK